MTKIIDQMHPDENNIQKFDLLHTATPLEPLPRLGKHIGLKNLFIKRDDEGGRGGGGNKIRKFERQLAKMILEGYDTVIIAAHHQSNAARELVSTAAMMGLKSVIVVKDLIGRKTESFSSNGNRLLLNLLGAELIEVPQNVDFMDFISDLAAKLRAEGASPYVLPFGASDALGCMGYVDCANEILKQIKAMKGRDPDIVTVPTGSCGTQAGLVAGFARQGVATKTVGFTILKEKQDAVHGVEALTKQTLQELGSESADFDVFIDDCARDDGYGPITPECLDAIRLTARLEGIFLDPVYTGKAMAGLISQVDNKLIDPEQIVVFVHTGGLPRLFVYSDAFKEGA
ncbi:MAG: pyridoxal-phosphate dependent enzyme [Robiginitomaculum sp.]|nr:pyridoxal-phosphate dependent enzyme [Robiginitomaculum sp.]